MLAVALPSGAGVIIRPVSFDHLCDRIWPVWEQSGEHKLPESHHQTIGKFPYIYWLDDAHEPRVIEQYTSSEQGEESAVRVRFIGLKARALAHAKLSKPADEVTWLKSWKKKHSNVSFEAKSVRWIPESVWRNHPIIAEQLARQINSTSYSIGELKTDISFKRLPAILRNATWDGQTLKVGSDGIGNCDVSCIRFVVQLETPDVSDARVSGNQGSQSLSVDGEDIGLTTNGPIWTHQFFQSSTRALIVPEERDLHWPNLTR